MAKDIMKAGNYKDYLKELPHKYFEENQLHAFIISGIKDVNECMEELGRFLPYIEEKRLDNWTHNKAIQKSVESRRITEEQKTYLRSLKVTR